MQTAHWITHEDDDRLCLQIELGNDYAVTLTYWKDGEEAEAYRELNRRMHVLVEAAQCLQVRAMMIEQLEREKHYALVGPTARRESDGVAFERADLTRRVAAFLASKALHAAIKNDDTLAEMLLGPPTESVSGVNFMEPRLPKQGSGRRSPEEWVEKWS